MITGFDIGTFGMPAGQLAALRQAYTAPPRAYHHFGHVQEVLGHYCSVADGPGWRQPVEVGYAVLYHDAVYVPGRRDNEAKSVHLAVEQLAQWQAAVTAGEGVDHEVGPEVGPEVDMKRVSELILLTARHGTLRSTDFANDDVADDTRHFLDCDMAILGAPADAFAAYDRTIAEEYEAVPRWLYRIKRRRFFKMRLASERIYLSDFFRDRFEAQARRNIEAML